MVTLMHILLAQTSSFDCGVPEKSTSRRHSDFVRVPVHVSVSHLCSHPNTFSVDSVHSVFSVVAGDHAPLPTRRLPGGTRSKVCYLAHKGQSDNQKGR